eukprot:15075155-Heterocapsa_arctica.AAC.1
MTGGLNPNVVPSVVTGTTGNENPASVAVSRSSASSEANHTVKSLFKTQDGTDEDRPWVAEYISDPPVLPTSSQPDPP